MTEENTKLSVSEMIRQTNDNTYGFFKHVADHIDALEGTILRLTEELAQLKGEGNGSNE